MSSAKTVCVWLFHSKMSISALCSFIKNKQINQRGLQCQINFFSVKSGSLFPVFHSNRNCDWYSENKTAGRTKETWVCTKRAETINLYAAVSDNQLLCMCVQVCVHTRSFEVPTLIADWDKKKVRTKSKAATVMPLRAGQTKSQQLKGQKIFRLGTFRYWDFYCWTFFWTVSHETWSQLQ